MTYPTFAVVMKLSALRLMALPATTAQSDSPERRLCVAKCTPTIDPEQPVSRARLVPLRLKKWDNRFAVMAA